MADINTTQPIRFEAGGILRIYDGASIDVTLINREKGTLRMKPGGYEPIHHQDRGVEQRALEGDERRSSIEGVCKLTKTHANDITSLSQTRDTAVGQMKEFSVDVSIPDYKGAATGTKYTFTNCEFPEPVEIIDGGASYDTVRWMLSSRNPHVTKAAY